MITTLSLGLVAFSKLATLVNAQNLEPLASKHFSYPSGIPFQVSGSDAGERGPQSGYNICNSTTEGPNSQCQTLLLNSIDDFCMWSSNLNTSDDTIAEGEAREVAWCTKPGHGARIIPQGALTGVQWLYAKDYLQVIGYIDQTKVGLQAADPGGELDPHGADEQGNPLGGIVFTNGFGLTADKYAQQLQSNSTPSTTFTQVIEWVDFIGNGLFCLKMCNPSDNQDAQLCNHIYDRVGCTYNAPADYSHVNGTFQVCDSDDMTPPGVFTTNGATTTWFQGPEGVPVSPPYTPNIPASSNCHTFSSEQLFGAATTSGASGSQTGGVSGGTGARSGSGSSASQTGTGAAVSLTGGIPMAFLVAVIAAFSGGMLLVL